jgi:glycerol-3-phosphate O-acyltransferase / dihydroxyacetone phosphate acyltransferase
MFAPQKTLNLSQPQAHAKACLIKYSALLHYTGIDHPSLATLYPPPTLASTTSKPDPLPSTKVAFLVFLTQLLTTTLHPRAIFFLPPLLVHIPAYVLGRLSVRLLATPGEEEGEAQFKAVFGGLGMGLSYTGVSLGLMTWLAKSSKGIVNPRDPVAGIVRGALNYPRVVWVLDKVGPLTTGGDKGMAGLLKCVLCLIGLTYGTASILSRWHRMLVVGELPVYRF